MENAALQSPHRRTAARAALLLIAAGGLSMAGCQVDVGGQTLPSAYYLQDDIQYFPAGPEFKLSNQVQAMEEYKLEREKLRAGLDDDVQ